MTAIPINTVSIGFCAVQASLTGTPGGILPKSSLADCTNADTGFHSANTRKGVGRVSEGTKAFEIKVNGNNTKNDTLLMISGLLTLIPMKDITHENE